MKNIILPCPWQACRLRHTKSTMSIQWKRRYKMRHLSIDIVFYAGIFGDSGVHPLFIQKTPPMTIVLNSMGKIVHF